MTEQNNILQHCISYFSYNSYFSMRRNSLYLLLLFIILTKAHVKSCKYWCKSHQRYYCCPSGKNDSSSEHSWRSFFFPWFWFGIIESHMEHPWHEVEMKPEKQCPPLRPHCPRTYEWYKPPKFCDSDHECEEWEKCCYDVCLEHKTCKNAE